MTQLQFLSESDTHSDTSSDCHDTYHNQQLQHKQFHDHDITHTQHITTHHNTQHNTIYSSFIECQWFIAYICTCALALCWYCIVLVRSIIYIGCHKLVSPHSYHPTKQTTPTILHRLISLPLSLTHKLAKSNRFNILIRLPIVSFYMSISFIYSLSGVSVPVHNTIEHKPIPSRKSRHRQKTHSNSIYSNKQYTASNTVQLYKSIKVPKYTLILDLDETLCYSTPYPSTTNQHYDHCITIQNKHNICKQFYVYRRPHVDQFLYELSKLYELVIFTASLKRYADSVIDIVDTQRLIRRRYYRSQCITQQNNIYNAGIEYTFVKDISQVCNSLKRTVILDNTPSCYSMNLCNAIPISTYTGQCDDTALLELLPFLQSLVQNDDVRTVLSKLNSVNAY